MVSSTAPGAYSYTLHSHHQMIKHEVTIPRPTIFTVRRPLYQLTKTVGKIAQDVVGITELLTAYPDGYLVNGWKHADDDRHPLLEANTVLVLGCNSLAGSYYGGASDEAGEPMSLLLFPEDIDTLVLEGSITYVQYQ